MNLICRLCKCEKPVERFSKRPGSKTGFRTECKDCLNIAKRKQPRYGKWHHENKGRLKEYNRAMLLKRKYDMTVEDFNNMLDKQHGACAICKTYAFMGKGEKPHVDHCHDTGKVRGLLCNLCNVGLGAYHDNPETLLAAANYLINTGTEIHDPIPPCMDGDAEIREYWEAQVYGELK